MVAYPFTDGPDTFNDSPRDPAYDVYDTFMLGKGEDDFVRYFPTDYTLVDGGWGNDGIRSASTTTPGTGLYLSPVLAMNTTAKPP